MSNPDYIYFDVASTTPIDSVVLDKMHEVNKNYFGNSSSVHQIGQKSHNLIEKSLRIRYEIGCEDAIEKTLNKMDLIKLGNKGIDIELKSSPVHNNLFPSRGIKISKPRESGKINFSLVNNIINDINKLVNNYKD